MFIYNLRDICLTLQSECPQTTMCFTLLTMHPNSKAAGSVVAESTP